MAMPDFHTLYQIKDTVVNLHLLILHGGSPSLTITLTVSLKGVFAKNERGYRLNAIKKRF